MPSSSPTGLIIAAPQSGSGKTVFTLGLLRHLAGRGHAVSSAKAGPDYIDPAFHARALGGADCLTFDPWAMSDARLLAGARALAAGGKTVICEGVMGLFDGTVSGAGSTADLAARTGWPVVLVVDAGNQGASAAALVQGFARHRADVRVAGVVFNRVGTPRHEAIVRRAMETHLPDVPVLGCVPRIADLSLPSRHLGLVQAAEHADLDAFMDRAAELVGGHVDTDALLALAEPFKGGGSAADVPPPILSLGQRIAVARDEAFAFVYAHVLSGWRAAGAEISFFSPLAGQGPDENADAVYLPGGYPELHAGKIAAGGFLEGVRAAAARGAFVFGECGGYMVLGTSLTDADGVVHEMAGLLGLETSFQTRKLHLGYRTARAGVATPLGPAGAVLCAHEFHYATITAEDGDPLFDAADGDGVPLGSAGLVAGRVAGSFLHLIANRED